ADASPASPRLESLELFPHRPRPARARRDLLERQAREDRLLGIARVGSVPGPAVALFDEEPLLARRFARGLHADESPLAAELVAEELEEELPLSYALVEVGQGSPAALIPADDLTGTVVAIGDDAREIGVLDRVVLDFDGQALLGGIGGGTLGDRPGLQDASPLQPEVPVQAASRMFLHHEEMRAVL